MMGRELTHRIGRARIARECEGLATATAEIDLAPLAASARLGQEVGPAERIEGRRRGPDIDERMLAHRPELEPGYAFRRVAGQHPPGGRDIEGAPAPAAD